eukprot:jgi/Psemu1/25541/gm1.25541_g
MFDKKGEADITLAEKNEKQIGKPEDDFQTVAMMQSIEEMKDCKKKNSMTSIIEHISAKKYIPQTKGAESIFKVLETYFQYMRLKHQYQLPTEIWMKIAQEDKKNEKEAASEMVPIEVATDPALQLGDTENIEEKAAKATDPIENNEREEKKKTSKDYLPMLPSWL